MSVKTSTSIRHLASDIFVMKLFTVEEANALLPAVRRVVEKIRGAHAQVAASQEAARAAAAGAQLGGGGMVGGPQYVRALTALAGRVGQLDELGVQLKDYERGLVDFPSLRDGKLVLLCWQWGEGDQIEWWHDPEAGFAGRQPL
jgi:hypothetical protein